MQFSYLDLLFCGQLHFKAVIAIKISHQSKLAIEQRLYHKLLNQNLKKIKMHKLVTSNSAILSLCLCVCARERGRKVFCIIHVIFKHLYFYINIQYQHNNVCMLFMNRFINKQIL